MDTREMLARALHDDPFDVVTMLAYADALEEGDTISEDAGLRATLRDFARVLLLPINNDFLYRVPAARRRRLVAIARDAIVARRYSFGLVRSADGPARDESNPAQKRWNILVAIRDGDEKLCVDVLLTAGRHERGSVGTHQFISHRTSADVIQRWCSTQ